MLKNFLLNLIPALGGLIGKISLVSSFALVWAAELDIDTPNFVLDNVRIELIVGSVITLVIAVFIPNTAPSGTLAPLIVLIPTMAKFGVHPFVLSILVGIAGIISIKTNIFKRLILLSGDICKTSLTLMFGISGVILSFQKLIHFYGNRYAPLILLVLTLVVVYVTLLYYKKTWLIIPIAAVVSLSYAWLFEIEIDTSSPIKALQFNPILLWDDTWGIGFGFDITTILKTLPFALFVILLWTIDTLSVQAIIHAELKGDERKEEININRSFIAVSIRNIIGGLLGGAQTGSLWRSFLIPLYMMKRPMRYSAVLLGVLGVIIGVAAIPIKLLSFPPLVWTVLLFGIFIPSLNTGIKNIKQIKNLRHRISILSLSMLGVVINPILTWLGAVVYEKASKDKRFM